MPTRKQVALADLMHWLICTARGPQSAGPVERLIGRRMYDRVLEDLYLIHKIPLSILDEEFTDNDIDFVNCGIGNYVRAVGKRIDARTAFNLVEVYDSIPKERMSEITFEMPTWLRQLARDCAPQAQGV